MAPSISVVVPTYQRSHLLPRLIAAFESQTQPPDFELIIVDNDSPDDTAEVLAQLTATKTVDLRVLVAHRRGPAAARNVGWRAARAPLIAFIDDDCVPAPTWVREMGNGLRDCALVVGRTDPDPEQAQRLGPFSRTMSVSHDNGLYATCNIGYRRSLLTQLDGFDESFKAAGGEDTDLAWRAIAAGTVPAFHGAAVVRHDIRASRWSTQLRDTKRWHYLPLTVAKHPAIRERFYAKVFWRRTHVSALAAAVGLIGLATSRGSGRRRAALMLLAPYLRDRLVVEPLPYTTGKDRVLLLPAALAVDLAEIGVLAIGSAAHGTVML